MSTLLSTVGLLLAALVATAGLLLAVPPDSALHGRVERDGEVILASLRDPNARSRVREKASAAARMVHPRLLPVLRIRGLDSRPAASAAVIRAHVATATLPLLGSLATLGVIAGFLRRRLQIERTGFHSLTFSYLGKAITAFSGAAFLFTAVSPLGPPIWTLYAFSLGVAGGAALFFGNLPPKL